MSTDVTRLLLTAHRRLSLHAALIAWGAGLSPAEQSEVLLDVWAELQVGLAAMGAQAFGAACGVLAAAELREGAGGGT